MSHLSDIWFSVNTQEEFQQLLKKAYKRSRQIKVREGYYSLYSDPSGAELFMQFNTKNNIVGVNPHFRGKSKRTVCLTGMIERQENEFEGAFYCWADPSEKNNPDSGIYPFVFDLPNFRTIGQIELPQNIDIQLTAFAHELSIYSDEEEYYNLQTAEPKIATQSFIPSGLFSLEGKKDSNYHESLADFTGIIKQYERRHNEFTSEEFYWLLVDTLGGEVDIVADIKYFEKEPIIGGIVQGAFGLSGQLINPPKREDSEDKSLLQKLFGW